MILYERDQVTVWTKRDQIDILDNWHIYLQVQSHFYHISISKLS